MTDTELLERFENCTLPAEQFTHRAHVKVAYLYLKQDSFEGALNKIRSGIQAYQRAQGVPDDPTMGYNETTTHALMHLIGAIMAAYSEEIPTVDAEAFCDAHPQLMSKHVLRFFYSPERRMLPEAKRQFVEPDLTSLPTILSNN
ncbi:MAG: hypothetical protein KDA57_16320 [Planctomycetales bacterium]|nr:hypothetical protein [Planctomycetales bacterium]